MKKLFLVFWILAVFTVKAEKVIYECAFASGKWNASDWQIVKSPRWPYIGSWEQQKDHISNKVPEGVSHHDLLSKRAGETYTSMLLKKKIEGNVTISSTMSFDYRMAPLLVITSAYGKDKGGFPEHREHFEIVLYDKGLNVWHHYFTNGKPHWRKAAFMNADFKPGEKYTVTVSISFSKRGPMMKISCNGKEFGYTDDSLPKEFYVGITGCEGINRFYDFKISK
jgi:hypothetical protein